MQSKSFSHFDFRIHAHVGLGDIMLSQKELKSMSKAICLHTVSNGLYHLVPLVETGSGLFYYVRLGMFVVTGGERNFLITTSPNSQLG